MLALAGCTTSSNGRAFLPPYESGEWGDATPRERELWVAKADFSMEVVRLTDARRPRSLERGPTEQVMDVYDPDTLLHGVSTRLPAMYEKYLAYKPKALKNYKVEFDVLDLRTEVLNGRLWNSRYGRYAIVLEVEATVRRPDSSVVLHRVYKVKDDTPRKTYDGRSPSQAMDETRLEALVDGAVRKTAMDLAWEVRQVDARRWHPEREVLVPTQSQKLVPQPPLEKATGSISPYGSDLVTPEETYATDSVPLMQIMLPAAPEGGEAEGTVEDGAAAQ